MVLAIILVTYDVSQGKSIDKVKDVEAVAEELFPGMDIVHVPAKDDKDVEKDPLEPEYIDDNGVEELQEDPLEAEIEKRAACYRDKIGNCRSFVGFGLCTDAQWKGYMAENCCKSCKGKSTGTRTQNPCARKGCSQGCRSTGRSATCTCNSGYTLKSDGKTCEKLKTCYRDKISKSNCKNYAKQGFCTQTYVQYMKDNCCKTCEEKAAGGSGGSGGNGGSRGSGGNRGSGGSGGKGGKCSKASDERNTVTGTGAAGCVSTANWYRKRHQNTPDMQWDATLGREAQDYADQLLRNNPRNLVLKHDPRNNDKGWGENLYVGIRAGASMESFCATANRNWYSEIFDYSYATGRSTGGAIGHFTQMVWTTSVKVGYGVAAQKVDGYGNWDSHMVYVVAKYAPAGNYVGRYKEHVMPRKSSYSSECIEEDDGAKRRG